MVNKIKNNLVNVPGWRTNRKIVVFESDDWGTIRMASGEAHERLLKKGYPVDQCAYNRNDSLESNDDLRGLMEVLYSVKDKNGKPAKFTINNIVANPNFQSIKESNFQSYFYEPFTITLANYSKTDQVMGLYREGLEKGVFQIQFHGREHVHVNNWLNALRQKEPLFLDAFEENMFTQYKGSGSSCRAECLDAMATYSDEDMEVVRQSIAEGVDLFESIWGFSPKSVIAPCYTWHSGIESQFTECDIRYIQGGRAQKEPHFDSKKKTIKRHYTGQRSSNRSIYFIRNVHFEQVENSNYDWVNAALKEISTAFTWGKPAIISSHRVNYIGSINPQNRDRNLNLLRNLLKKIVQVWPEVEFLSTDELGDTITKKR